MIILVVTNCHVPNSHKYVALQGELVLKMHYIGHRLLSDGRKVYCLHAEKMNSDNTEEIKELLNNQRKRKATGARPSCTNTPPVLTKEAKERNEAAKRSKAPLVSRKNVHSSSSSDSGQKFSHAAKSQQLQQQRQQPQQQHQTQQRQTNADLAEQVSEVLLHHPRLDNNLANRYLQVFASLSDDTKDFDGKSILGVAEEPSGEGLQVFLETVLRQHS